MGVEREATEFRVGWSGPEVEKKVEIMAKTKLESTQDVRVKLTGTDGNVFAIIGKVSRALKDAGFREEARAFEQECFGAGSYDEVLVLCMKTVDVR